MVWAIVVVAIAVLGAAAWAGTGRLGEMPGAVTDRPKAHIPDGPVDEHFMEAVSLPLASTGYRRSQVDGVLASHVAGERLDAEHRFDVVRRGYDMQAVDMILDRIRPGIQPMNDEDVLIPAHALDTDAMPATVTEGTDVVEPEHAELGSEALDGVAPSGSTGVETVEETVPPGADPARQESVESASSRDLPAH